jgi:hypothetical protein
MPNFSSLASTQMDLDKFLTIFEENSRKIQDFIKENLEFSKSEKPQNLNLET